MVSFPSSLVGFLGFHPCMHCFHSENYFVTCSCCFFFFVVIVLLFRNSEVGGEAERNMHGIKYDNVHIIIYN